MRNSSGHPTKDRERKRTAQSTDFRTSARALESTGRWSEPDWETRAPYLNRVHGHGSQRFPGWRWVVRGTPPGPEHPCFGLMMPMAPSDDPTTVSPPRNYCKLRERGLHEKKNWEQAVISDWLRRMASGPNATLWAGYGSK